MSFDKQLLKALVPTRSYCRMDGDDFIFCQTLNFSVRHTIHRTSKDLESIHPLAPIGIRLLFNGDSIIEARLIGAMLSLWDANLFAVDSQNRRVAFWDVNGVFVVLNGLKVSASAFCYTERLEPCTNHMFLLPTLHIQEDIELNSEWLDLQNPKWRQHIVFANTLMLEPVEALRFVLQGFVYNTSAELPSELA